jgi:hypothetical protein
MQGSKIRLSAPEAALIGNAEVILTKNSIVQKTVALLAEVQEALMIQEEMNRFSSSPKISKGENYKGLPWVVLDYPRISSGGDLFFIRSMFWWGNFFSSTLQLAGWYKEKSLAGLTAAFDHLATEDYFIGVGEDPWQHHFESSNYKKLSDLSRQEYIFLLEHQPYIKIAARWPLSDWDLAANHFCNSWKNLVVLIA